jgi:5-methylcytosine-specific restriction protein A
VDQETKKNPTWTRDELILTLDFYFHFNGNPPSKESAEIKALSDLLNRMAGEISKGLEKFRNANGVYMKIMNFRRFDPAFAQKGAVGLSRGGRGDEEVWKEYHNRRVDLHSAAEAIRSTINSEEYRKQKLDDDPEIAEAEEGKILTRVHISRERNRELIKKKKADVLKRLGSLKCEVCSFDFKEFYGDRGEGFAEIHHLKPLNTLQPGSITRLEDLSVLCANCHRMVHAKKPWLSLDELKKITKNEIIYQKT